MRKILVLLILPILGMCGGGYETNSVETVAEKIRRLTENEPDRAYRTLVIGADRIDEVIVANITYKDDLTCDIYYPPEFPMEDRSESVPIPFVLFPTSFTLETFESWERDSWKDQDLNISWGQVLAARGIAAVFYDAQSVTEDLEDIMKFLLARGSKLGLDTQRIGVVALSNNGRIGMTLALDSRPEYARAIRSAAFLHASIRAAAIRRKDIPVFLVYTRDSGSTFASLNEAFIERGERAGLQITVRDDAPFKGFEYDDPTPLSREILTELLQFMDRYLKQ